MAVAAYGAFAMLVVAGCSWGLRETAFLSTREINDDAAGSEERAADASPEASLSFVKD